MRDRMNKYWPILLSDPILTPHPSITARRAENGKDHLVQSHYQGKRHKEEFGSKGKRWRLYPMQQMCGVPEHRKLLSFGFQENLLNIRLHSQLPAIQRT